MAEASVAVKMQETMPPITTTSNIKLGKASIKVEKTLEIGALFLVGMLFFLAQIIATIIKNKPVIIPGIYPAKNKAEIEAPPLANE